MSILSTIEGVLPIAQKTEQWVVAEIAKGWADLETGAKDAVIDVKGLFDYIASHQTAIDTTAQAILGDVSLAATLVGHPEVAATATAVAASADAITALAANIDKGSVPLPDIVSTLHTVKDAQTAVNALVKTATAKPAPKAAAPTAH
jgi:hypothetical protein